MYLSWEIDEECLSVSQHHHAEIESRGDFLADDPDKVVQRILEVDPQGAMILIMASAPPCPDFSRIKEDAPGSDGPEGHKFTQYCHFARAIEAKLPHRRIGHLVENVVMLKSEADTFSQHLSCNAVVVDAADHGLVSRPRLWWQRVDWGHIRWNPLTNERLQWSKSHKFHRLHQDATPQDVAKLELDGLQIHPRVATQECRIPCLTTPAPTDAGRPPPKKMRGKIHPEQKKRWMEDHQRFAPWQYADEAMLQDSQGNFHVPSAEAKEQFHQLPIGYTRTDKTTDRGRHRMMANGWHFGTAKFMMLLVIQTIMNIQCTALPMHPCRSALQRVTEALQNFAPAIGPGTWQTEPLCVPPTDNMWDHWALSTMARHPLQLPPRLEPGLAQCLTLQRLWGHELPRLRSLVVDEIEEMVETQSEATLTWWKGLPPHIAQVYYNKELDEISQIPIFLQLLAMVQMPCLDELAQDLCTGFHTIGRVHDGAGWLPRRDQRYDHPISHEAFKDYNKRYTVTKLKQNRVDQHWEPMMTELMAEISKGRMSGPYAEPSWWPTRTRDLPGMAKQPLPADDICVSFCFSVVQSDKIRRCEDYKRSGHNATVIAHTVPAHHDIHTFSDLARALPVGAGDPMVWAQDLAGAYRQFPVAKPEDTYCALLTPEGPLLLRHHALMFGAAASVWCFNRSADSLTFLCRRLLAVSVGHYVDDFVAVEPESIVHSGYEQFTRLARILGLRMKETKALPPASSQKVLGIQMTLSNTAVTLHPHPNRCKKVIELMQTSLQENRLTCDQAQRLAGKLIFMASTMFGQIGKAALRPIYARSHGLSDMDKASQLNGPLRTALRTMIGLLHEVQPRVIPREVSQKLLILYTDAFFTMHGQEMSPGQGKIPQKWNQQKCPTYQNGWGCVWHYRGETKYAAGSIPVEVLKLFCSRRAFIYFLELVTQLIGFVATKHYDTNLIMSFIDNTSGFFAMQKGFCKDGPICNMLALMWRLLSALNWNLQLEWVSSGNNVADQVSRHKFHEMAELRAEQFEGDLSAFFKILMKVAIDAEYAHGQALSDLMRLRIFEGQPRCTVRLEDAGDSAVKSSSSRCELADCSPTAYRGREDKKMHATSAPSQTSQRCAYVGCHLGEL